MTAYIYEKILEEGIKEGMVPNLEKESRNWFREQADAINNINNRKLVRVNRDNLRTRFRRMDIGKMFLFEYFPKGRKTLPYWDRWPLIILVDTYKDGFLGLNLHYLPLRLRAKFFDELYAITNNKAFDETTRFKITYEKLKRVRKFRYYRPCLKRYLTPQLKTRKLLIDPIRWDIALFLNNENFRKRPKSVVWKDSRKIILEN